MARNEWLYREHLFRFTHNRVLLQTEQVVWFVLVQCGQTIWRLRLIEKRLPTREEAQNLKSSCRDGTDSVFFTTHSSSVIMVCIHTPYQLIHMVCMSPYSLY